jgi:hypothetical protein
VNQFDTFSFPYHDVYRVYEPASWPANPDAVAAIVPLAELTPGVVGVYQMKLALQPLLGAGNRQIVLVRDRFSFFGFGETYVSSPVILPVM